MVGANTYLHNAAWHFGVDLLNRTDRTPVDVDKLVATIQQQQKSITGFDQLKAKPAETPPSQPFGIRNTRGLWVLGPDDQVAAVALATDQLLSGLVNVEALVLGFDTCASTALSNATPPITDVQTIKVE